MTDKEEQEILDRIREVQERYRLPDDLTEGEKKAVAFLDTLGYSEADKALRIRGLREDDRHKENKSE